MSASGSMMMHVKTFQYIGGCSVHRRMFSTSGVFSTFGGYHEYIGDIMSTSRDVQYIVGYHHTCRGAS